LALALPAGKALGQSANAPLNADYYHLAERYEIAQGRFSELAFTGVRPYQRRVLAQWADTLAARGGGSRADAFNLAYLQRDNWAWSGGNTDAGKPLLRHFFQTPAALFRVSEPNFALHANLVLSAGLGRSTDRPERVYASGRGVELRGHIARKIGFYTLITDNQARFARYVMGAKGAPAGNLPQTRQRGALPQAGFWKEFEGEKTEFFRARGHISFQLLDEINLQAGHDRHFIGNGYRSLALSDFAPEYFFLRMNTRVWKLQYTNLYAVITPRALTDGEIFKDKYFALHHLSVNLTPKLNVGVFENVVFSRGDSLQSNTFDVNYLNPVIFTRAVEHNRASLDNIVLGFDAKWQVMKRLQLYGQLVLDEFKTAEFLGLNSDGSYLNKYGVQAGAKYVDALGIRNLDLQAEWNKVRPFTYSHNQSGQRLSVNDANYQHFGQPLAHPLGANFWEVVGVLRYQPVPRLQLQAVGFYALLGEDAPGQNWGGNIFQNYNQATQQVGNEVGQGVQARLRYVELLASYQLAHNLFVDARQLWRQFDSDDDARDLSTSLTTLTLRWNLPHWRYEF
jgi:hypothetical protein